MKIFLLIATLFVSKVFALEAQVIVLEAPLLQKPQLNSKVVQLVRKGDKIYLPSEYDEPNPNLPQYNPDHRFEAYPASGFYETMDKSGQPAFIPAKYVKVIWKDEREFSQDLNPWEHDPTDYRIAEPIPDGYPLVPKNKFKALVSFVTGPDEKNNFAYGSSIVKEDFSNRYGLDMGWLNKVNWDPYDRFYFGALATIQTSQAKIELFDDRKTSETRGFVGLGPLLSYDVYRTEKNRFTVLSALMIRYNRSIISQKSSDTGEEEERFFSGWSFGPKFSGLYSFRNAFPFTDFFVGLDLQVILPHTTQANSNSEFSDLWGDTTSLNHGFNAQMSLNIGIISWN